MPRLIIAPTLLVVLLAAAPLQGQFANRKAVEVVVTALPPQGEALLVVRSMIAPDLTGKAALDEANLQPLIERYGAIPVDREEVIRCADESRPETCRLRRAGVLYQFVMPLPIDSEGRLDFRVFITRNAEDGGLIRELWRVGLQRHAQLGWNLMDRELEETFRTPW